MTDETTTEQLAEIEGQAEQPLEPQPVQVREGQWRTRGGDIRNVTPTPAHDSRAERWPWRDAEFDQTWSEGGLYNIIGESSLDLVKYLGPIEPDKTQELETTTQELPEYTPPEGWRVLRYGELLQPGDHWVNWEGTVSRPDIQHGDGATVSGGRYIRRIEPQPVQVREGRWRTRSGEVKNIRSCEPLKGAYYVWPWTDGFMTFQDNGRHQGSWESAHDLVDYLGPIEPDKTQELSETGEESSDQLIGRISLLRQRVTQLEELVTSLRTINEGAEKAVSGAGVVNDSLRLQLAAVKAELASVAADRQRLQIELDAAQQVPADSPELRQVRADLAEVTRERDQYLDSYQRIFGDLETIRETTKAETVEAIAEWLQAFRGCNSPSLALLLLEALPSIMRSLTGLSDEEIE